MARSSKASKGAPTADAKRDVQAAAKLVGAFIGGKSGKPATSKRRPAAKPSRPSEVRDTKSDADRDRAKREERSPRYREAARRIYAAQPVEKRREQIAAKKPGPAADAARGLNAERARARKAEKAADRLIDRVRGVPDDRRDAAVRRLLGRMSGDDRRDVVKGLRVKDRRAQKDTLRAALAGAAGKPLDRVQGEDRFDRATRTVSDVVGDLFSKVGAGAPTGGLSEAQSRQLRERAGEVARVGTLGVLQTGRTVAENPELTDDVAGDILKSIPAAVAGAASLPVKVVTDGPEDAAREAFRGTVADFEKRYAKAAEGDLRGFREDVKKDPAGYVVDAATAAAGGTAAAGRAATGLVGRVAARPVVRVAPGRTERQPASENLAVRALQAARDGARRDVQERRVRRGDQRGEQPQGKGEVVQIRRGLAAAGPVQTGRYVGGQTKKVRTIVARANSTANQRMRQALDREIRPAEEAVVRAKLKPDADDLARPYVLQGLLPLDDPAGAVAAIDAQVRRIEEYRRAQGSELPRTPGMDELPRLRALRAAIERNPAAVFTPALRELHAQELARGERLRETVGESFEDATVQARRWAPVLLRYEPEAARELRELLDDVADDPEERRIAQGLYAEMGQMIAAERGLPEPVYFLHRSSPRRNGASMASGGLARGAGPRRYSTDFELLQRGEWDPSHAAYVEGLARSVKRATDYRHAAELLEDLAHPDSRGPQGRGITVREAEQLRDRLEADGRSGGELMLWRPKVVAAGEVDSDIEIDAESPDLGRFGNAEDFRDTDRVFLLPRAAVEEIEAGSGAPSEIGRALGNLQGLTSRALIHTNPTFPLVQILSNAPLALFTVGARDVAAFLKAPKFFRDLDEQTRDEVRALFANEGVGSSSTRLARRGTLDRQLGVDRSLEAGARVFSALGLGRAAITAPFRGIAAADRLQDTYLRDVVTFAALKKNERTFKRSAAAAADLFDAQRPVIELLSQDGKNARRALRDPKVRRDIEAMAEKTVEFLGDYARYSASERKILRKSVLFYGFLRHSTKLLLHTLPWRHPLMLAFGAQLAQLEKREVDHLFAAHGAEAPVWAYGRVYLGKDGSMSVDLARVNPITNTFTEGLGEIAADDERLGALNALVPPMVGIPLEIVDGRNRFVGRDLRTDGGQDDSTLEDAPEVLLNRVESLLWPAREARKRLALGQGEPGDDDTLVRRLITGKGKPLTPPIGSRADTRNERKKERQRQDDRGILGALVPLLPKPDHTIADTAERAERERFEQEQERRRDVRRTLGLLATPRRVSPSEQTARDREARIRQSLDLLSR